MGSGDGSGKGRLGLVLLGLAFVLFGCDLLKKKGAQTETVEEDPVADAATVTVTGSGATNEKDVRRYEKETKLADVPAVISKDGTQVKNYPALGLKVATLGKGYPVVQIAKYFSTGVLVTFDDPSGGGKLMGWVPPDALAAPGTTPATTATATATWKPSVTPTAPSPKDAGAPPPPADAGHPATPGKDAGAKPAPTTTTPPGKAPPPGAAVLFVPLGADGTCPAGFAKSAGGCKRPCTTDANCPRSTFCVSRFCSASK
jgi:hypothetical protein